MAASLRAKFPGRLAVFFGNSSDAVARYLRTAYASCDIISVDGAHDFEGAVRDIQLMARLARPWPLPQDEPGFASVVVLDDVGMLSHLNRHTLGGLSEAEVLLQCAALTFSRVLRDRVISP